VPRSTRTVTQNKQQLAKVLSMEMGKPMKQALGEISATQSRVKFAVDNAFKALEPITMSETTTFEERVEYEPLGVVANISAWNYPYFVARSVLASSALELGGCFGRLHGFV